MSMINSLKFPSWLKHCTETRFYVERCEEQAKKYETIYYRSRCMHGNPSMRGMLEKFGGASSPRILASLYSFMEDLGVELGDLSHFWDASNIQVYRINFKQVVYLNLNEKGRAKKNDRNPKCESCRRKLIDSEYRFCFVACKMRSKRFSYRVRRKARFPQRAPLSSLCISCCSRFENMSLN